MDNLQHSKGPWKDHKYVEVKDGRYIYNTGEGKGVSKRGEGLGTGPVGQKDAGDAIHTANAYKLKDAINNILTEDFIKYIYANCKAYALDFPTEDKKFLIPEYASAFKMIDAKTRNALNSVISKVDSDTANWLFEDVEAYMTKHLDHPQLIPTLPAKNVNDLPGMFGKTKSKDAINHSDFLAHYGVSKLDGAPGRGSGRYPLGSGEDPRALKKAKKEASNNLKKTAKKYWYLSNSEQIKRGSELYNNKIFQDTLSKDKDLVELISVRDEFLNDYKNIFDETIGYQTELIRSGHFLKPSPSEERKLSDLESQLFKAEEWLEEFDNQLRDSSEKFTEDLIKNIGDVKLKRIPTPDSESYVLRILSNNKMNIYGDHEVVTSSIKDSNGNNAVMRRIQGGLERYPAEFLNLIESGNLINVTSEYDIKKEYSDYVKNPKKYRKEHDMDY